MRTLGKHSPLVKELARLKDAAGRREQGRFLVEGVRSLEELLASPVELEYLLVSGGGPRVEALLGQVQAEVLEVEPALLERLTPAETSQGVLGVARLPAERPAEVLRADSLLVLEEISDPGNLGTLLRSARASGTGGVVLLGGADPYSPKVVRSAAGAVFRLPLARLPLTALSDFSLVATVVDGGDNLYTCDLPNRPAWLLGSEARGLSSAALGSASRRVTLPMRDGESLNVGVCGALLMFEWLRRQEVPTARKRESL